MLFYQTNYYDRLFR